MLKAIGIKLTKRQQKKGNFQLKHRANIGIARLDSSYCRFRNDILYGPNKHL